MISSIVALSKLLWPARKTSGISSESFFYHTLESRDSGETGIDSSLYSNPPIQGPNTSMNTAKTLRQHQATNGAPPSSYEDPNGLWPISEGHDTDDNG